MFNLDKYVSTVHVEAFLLNYVFVTITPLHERIVLCATPIMTGTVMMYVCQMYIIATYSDVKAQRSWVFANNTQTNKQTNIKGRNYTLLPIYCIVGLYY